MITLRRFFSNSALPFFISLVATRLLSACAVGVLVLPLFLAGCECGIDERYLPIVECAPLPPGGGAGCVGLPVGTRRASDDPAAIYPQGCAVTTTPARGHNAECGVRIYICQTLSPPGREKTFMWTTPS